MTEESSTNEYEAPALQAEDVVIFPHTEVSITSRDQRNMTALLQASKERQLIVAVPRYDSKDFTGSIGTLAHVRKTAIVRGGVNASVKGLWRVRVEKVLEETAYARIRFTKVNEIDDASAGESKAMQVVLDQIEEFVNLIPGIPSEITDRLLSAETPGKLADLCGYSPTFTSEERIDLLKTLGAEERLEIVRKNFERQLAALKEISKFKPIPECETCAELADRAFESGPNQSGEIASEFLSHVVQEHPGELLGLISEKYGSTFMRRRAMK
ncbi:MAG: LON peptidase substrate-binding domain-containing protein [Thaumarchaeota archaeon]|nr:LON peptidase substrate-binding domain-containing protein [Nitrososphaerota archaeon]